MCRIEIDSNWVYGIKNRSNDRACVWLKSYSNNRTLCALHSESRVLRARQSFRCALNQNFQLWRASSLGMLHYVFINFLPIEKCIRELCAANIDFVFVGRVIKHFSMYAVHEYRMADGWWLKPCKNQWNV